MKRPEGARQRTGEPFAKLGTHTDGAQGFGRELGELEFNGLIQRNAEHVVQGPEVTLVFLKHLCFFLRQACAPILLDGPAAGQGGAAVVFQGGPPRAQAQEYIKRISITTTGLCWLGGSGRYLITVPLNLTLKDSTLSCACGCCIGQWLPSHSPD